MPEREFTNQDLMKLLKLTHRQVIYWTEKFLGDASIKKASGRGSMRVYSDWDAFLFLLAKDLRVGGMDYQWIRRVLDRTTLYFPDGWEVLDDHTQLNLLDNRYMYFSVDDALCAPKRIFDLVEDTKCLPSSLDKLLEKSSVRMQVLLYRALRTMKRAYIITYRFRSERKG